MSKGRICYIYRQINQRSRSQGSKKLKSLRIGGFYAVTTMSQKLLYQSCTKLGTKNTNGVGMVYSFFF